MKRKLIDLSRRYQAALQKYLNGGHRASLESARTLGREAFASGLQTLDLARLHEQILVTKLLPNYSRDKRARFLKQAGSFFAATIIPIEKTPTDARVDTSQLNRSIGALSQRTVELAASNLKLSKEIAQRKAVEEALKKSERHYSESLEQSDRLQEQLRELSRQILSAQEDERRKISRELHDVIAQILTGINIRLSTLKKEAARNIKGIDRNIAMTQQLVEKSVNIVHQFARELRPAVLDDLGLIPALHAFMKNFTTQTGIHTQLIAFAEVEKLDAVRRTVLFRVAQEALTNVARHANASHVEVNIRKWQAGFCMKIRDDGKSFNVTRVLLAKGGRRLGLLGMRERLEMIGGKFNIESIPGTGTTIQASIPSGNYRLAKSASKSFAHITSL